MATVVAVAGVAVAAAAAAQQAAAANKAGGGATAPGAIPMTPWEKIFNRGTADMQDEERRVMEDALSQANFIQPELYKLLGFEPIYDDRIAPDQLSKLGELADAVTLRSQEGKTTIQDNKLEIIAKRKELRELKRTATKGMSKADRKAARQADRDTRQGLKEEIQDLRKESKEVKHTLGPLQEEAGALNKALGDYQTLPRRVIGLKKLEGGPQDPTGSKGDLFKVAFDLENEALVNALQGKGPIDTTLQTRWDEKERQVRERLRRQLGPDYETSTAGSQAIASFDRERADSFSSYNTAIVAQLSQETESRATSLSNLTGTRLQQLLFPANAQIDRAKDIGTAASARLGVGAMFQNERLAALEGNQNAFAQNVANQQARSAAISQAVNQGAGAVNAALPTLGSALSAYTGSTTRAPTPAEEAAGQSFGTPGIDF